MRSDNVFADFFEDPRDPIGIVRIDLSGREPGASKVLAHRLLGPADCNPLELSQRPLRVVRGEVAGAAEASSRTRRDSGASPSSPQARESAIVSSRPSILALVPAAPS
jgi:hypothetical protein